MEGLAMGIFHWGFNGMEDYYIEKVAIKYIVVILG